MKKYDISYCGSLLATVEIDPGAAIESIKAMVEFWTGWEEKLEDNEGCYITTWLCMLAVFLVSWNRIPFNDEGWINLEHGKTNKGITVFFMGWEPDEDEIEIELIG